MSQLTRTTRPLTTRTGVGDTDPVRTTDVAPSPLFVLLVAATVVGGGFAASGDSVARTAGVVVLVLGGWAASLCLHEFGHALVAYRGGDHSVRAKGYLTLDIRRYTDPVMSLLLPLLLLAVGGIPLPGGAVWINHGALRSPAVSSAVSLAGPLTNLVLGAVLIAVVGTGTLPYGLAAGLSYLALVQVLAFALNILPVPGLDGFGVLEPFLPLGVRRFAHQVRPYAPLLLFVLIIGVPQVSYVLFDTSFTLFGALGGEKQAAYDGLTEFMFWR